MPQLAVIVVDNSISYMNDFKLTRTKIMISRVVPKLPYIDKQQTIKFYVDQLGFKLRSDFGDYIIIDLPNAELHFFAYPDLEPGKSDFMSISG
jgi:hypothetical protein